MKLHILDEHHIEVSSLQDPALRRLLAEQARCIRQARDRLIARHPDNHSRWVFEARLEICAACGAYERVEAWQREQQQIARARRRARRREAEQQRGQNHLRRLEQP